MKSAPEIEWNTDVWTEKQSTTKDFTTLLFYRHRLHGRQYAFVYWLEGKGIFQPLKDFDDVTQHFIHHQATLYDSVLWSWRRKDVLGVLSPQDIEAHLENVLKQMLEELEIDGWKVYGFFEDRDRKRFILNR